MRKDGSLTVNITGEAAEFLLVEGAKRGDGPAAELKRCIETHKFLADAVLDGARVVVVNPTTGSEINVDTGHKTHFDLWEEQI